MATNTPNYNLTKPAGTDTVDIGVINTNMDLIDAAVALKAPLASPTLTGTPTVPTAAVNTNTTQAASTAFVLAQAGTVAPVMDGVATVGVATKFARADHTHPSDTAKADQAAVTSHLAENSSQTVKGHVELATAAETTTGTDNTRAVHPAGLKVELDKKIAHSLATAVSDFLVSSGAGVFVKKTLEEVKTILGLGTAAYTASTAYATAAQGTLATNAMPLSQKGAVGGVALFDDVTAHLAESATLSELAHVKHGTLTTTLDTAWAGAQAPFTKTQAVAGILATDNPIVDVTMGGTYSTDEARLDAWSQIYRITTANDSITLYAKKAPTVALPIQLKVVR
ncbi:Phage tail fiber protein [Desulfosporosinus sp. I2]|uniref:hypothetical protein n=1 Tax=Desulfosporosinus sp. I2 TaxID=1617025 RepID=UPI0005EDED45|nr:hypothetical protein [Desulfosporosinus sp. I2]KJR48388.1 Phage tail fiber protein [Desulfosporosinus sp. I2]